MKLLRLTLVLSAALAPLAAFAELQLLGGVSIPGGGEVVAHYNSAVGADYVLVTNSAERLAPEISHKVDIYLLGADANLTYLRSADFDALFGTGSTLSVSSVAADPAGRGFAAAAIIPSDNAGTLGKVAFFSLDTGAILWSTDVGYHPDAVRFTPDGSKLLVANEGEFVETGTQAPGSVSIIDLAHITNPASFAPVPPLVATVDFNTGLASGVDLEDARIHVPAAPDADRYLHIEPEFVATINAEAYVTLQEANAVAVLDLASNQFTAIHPLGTIEQRVDASNEDPEDGGLDAIHIDDDVAGLPMPDTIVTFLHRNGNRYLATANEGDARVDDGDIMRLRDQGETDGGFTFPAIDPTVRAALDLLYAGNALDDAALGRLNVSFIDGDTDGDGDIDVPTMLGTRSFTIWDTDGNIVFDSGSMIEEYVRDNHPLTFNINDGTIDEIDQRSDDKGPEPEALAFGELAGRQYIFVAAERQNGVYQFDITDLAQVQIVGYYNVIDGSTVTTGSRFVSPETIVFVPAEQSPTGSSLLLVGYEGVPDEGIDGSVGVLAVSAPEARLINCSVRSAVAGGHSLIVGFSTSGPASNLLVRAVGPGLEPFGVNSFLADPRIALYQDSVVVAANEDWGGEDELTAAFALVGAFDLADLDAALLQPAGGGYTAHVAARSTGVTLVEIYDTGSAEDARLINLSARHAIKGGNDTLIAGFVVGGSGTQTLLIRGVGPSLADFGVETPLADPVLEVYEGEAVIAENDDWGTGNATAGDFDLVGAFPLEGDSTSAALKLTANAGVAYTVHLRSADGAGGEALVEVYVMP